MEYHVIILKDTGKKIVKSKHDTLNSALDSAKKLWRSLPLYNAMHWDVEVRGYKNGDDSEYTTYEWHD